MHKDETYVFFYSSSYFWVDLRMIPGLKTTITIKTDFKNVLKNILKSV